MNLILPGNTSRTKLAGYPNLANQADTDEQLLQMWLHGRAKSTQKAYALVYLHVRPQDSSALHLAV